MSKDAFDFAMDEKYDRHMKYHEDFVYALVDGEEAFNQGKNIEEINMMYRSDGYIDGFKKGYEDAKNAAMSRKYFDEPKHR